MTASTIKDGAASLLEKPYRQVLSLGTKHVMERAFKARYLTRAHELESWWQQPAHRRDKWRNDALATILHHAADQVPAYIEFRASSNPLKLSLFPVTNKDIINAGDYRYFSAERDAYPAMPKRTGGSTGDPWKYQLDKRAWAESYAIQIHRFAQLGHHYGSRKLYLGSPTSLGINTMGAKKKLRYLTERTDTSLCSFNIERTASLQRAIDACATQSSMWYGYASTVAAMADAALESGQEFSGPPLIVTMAEPLWPDWHRKITEAFGSLVVEEYGCNDGGIMAHRCASGNLHLADHQSIVEILDNSGLPVPHGEFGNITITNLHARHMPFIRYQPGDTGRFGPKECSCGQPGRTISEIAGRSGDFIRVPNGTDLTPIAFYSPFNQINTVLRWQIVQPDDQSLVVRVDPRSDWTDSDEKIIFDWVRDRTDGLLDITITTDEEFEITSGGKHKIIIRQFG